MKNRDFWIRVIFRSLAAIILAYLALSNICMACECIGAERPCEHLRGSDAVFVGRVLDTVPVKRPVDKDSYRAGYIMHFAVENSLLGALGAEITIETGGGGGDCGTPLPVGDKFLIFAYKNENGQLWTGMCSGNRQLGNDPSSDQLVEQYRTLVQTGTGSIFGRVVSTKPVWDGDDVRDGPDENPMRGTVVRAKSGEFTTTTKTLEDGSYEFDRLPNGTYTIAPEIRSNLDFDHENEDRYQADVANGGCANISFKLEPNTRIRGHLAWPDNLELKLIQVVALPTHLKDLNQYSGQWDLTDENNRFDIWPLPPGDYYVGVNIGSSPKADAPFPPTYYPGVTRRQAATIIHIREGETKELNLSLPEVAKPRKVHFVAIGLDGKPLRKIYVQLEDLRHPGDADSYENIDLDDSGAGTLTIYSEYSYHLHGSHWVSYGNDWCSEPVIIPAGTDPVEARFVMNRRDISCEIREIDSSKKK